MISHPYTSPLRYPGGKGMLANFMKLLYAQNGMLDGRYAEIYAGGATIAWALLFDEFAQHVYVNDISKAVYAFWKCVVDETEALCRLINDTPVTMEEWRRQKAVQLNVHKHSQLEIAFSTFFLNRTNRSGILVGGVIGGKGQTGAWKLDARFNKTDLINRIERIAKYRHRISIYNQDAADFIKTTLPQLPQQTLVFLDPPYYVKGRGLYEDYYSHAEHAEIATLVSSKIQQPWVVSYDAVEPIIDLYNGFNYTRYDLSYSAQNRYAGSEIMFFSPDLRLPDFQHPAKIKLPKAFSLPML